MADFNLTIGSSSDASTVNSVGAGPNFAIVIASAPTRTIVVGDYLTDFGSNDYLITAVASQTAFTVVDHLGNGDPVTGVGSTQRAYNSLTTGLSDAEADIGNYASSGDSVEWQCYNDGTLDDVAVINDTTLGTSGQLTITSPAGERHTGTAGTGFVIDPNSNGSVVEVTLSAAFTIEFIEITGWIHSSSSSAGIFIHSSSTTAKIVRNCIVHDDGIVSANSSAIITQIKPVNVRNCLVYDVSSGSAQFGLRSLTNDATVFENCTAERAGIGVISKGVNIVAKNIAAINNTIDYSGTFSALSTNNADGDGTAPGDNALNSLTASDEFVLLTDGSEDYRLKSTSSLRDAGTDLSSTFTRDVINNIRALNSDWDIGAFDWDEVSATIGSASGTAVTINTVVGEAPEWTLTLSATAPADLIAGQKINDGTTDFLVRKSLENVLTVRRVDFTTVVDPVTGVVTTLRMYDKLSTAETDTGDIVEAGNGLTWLCMNDEVLDDNVTIDNTTLGSSGQLTITSPLGERHTGTAGTGFTIDPSSSGNVITASDSMVTPLTIQFIEIVDADADISSRACLFFGTGGNNHIVESCILHDSDTAAASTMQGIRFRSANFIARNNLIYDCEGTGMSVQQPGGVIQNCVLRGNGAGFVVGAGNDPVLENNAVFDNSTNFSGDFDSSSGNNASDTAESSIPGGTGSGNLGSLTAADEFKDLTDGSENYRTKGGSALRDNGADLSATFTKDIVSVTRTPPFDIGAFQFTGAAGAWFPVII